MTLLAGQRTAGTTTDYANALGVSVFKYTAAATGLAQRIHFTSKVANAGHGTIYLGIYNDNGSGTEPGNTLLSKTAAITSGHTGTGEFFVDLLTPVRLTSGTVYWLGLANGDGSNSYDWQADASGTSRYLSSGYSGVLPTDWTTQTDTAGSTGSPVFSVRTVEPVWIANGSNAVSANSVANPTNLTPGIPSGMVAGDLMLCFTCCRSNTATVATPSGWELVTGYPVANGNASGGTHYVFARHWQSGDGAPTCAWSGVTTGTSGDSNSAIILGLRGAELYYCDATTATGSAGAITTTASIAAVTTGYDSSLVISFTCKINDTAHTWTPTTGWTEWLDNHTTNGTGHSKHIQGVIQAVAGSSGAQTIAPSTTTSSQALSTTLAIAALRPRPRQAASDQPTARAASY